MNIADLLSGYSDSDSIAIVCGTEYVTYRQLCSRIRSTSSAISCRKLPIGIFIDNSIEYLVAYFAVLYSGNMIVPINWKLSAREIRKVCMDCGIAVLFSVSKYEDRIDDLGLNIPAWYLDKFKLSDYSVDSWEAVTDSVNAEIIPTSGTTGASKYVILSHDSLFHNIEYMGCRFVRERGGKEVILLPFCTILTQAQMLHCISVGMQMILFQGEFDSYRLCELLVHENVTSSAMVPSMLRLLGASAEMGKYKFNALERIFFAGDYMGENDFETLRRQLPGIFLIQAYGMTEISPICMKGEADFAYKARSAGKLFPEVRVKILEEGVEVETGKIGEIYARGSNGMECYLNSEGLVDGYICTGDMGYIDSEGYLFICGRKKT